MTELLIAASLVLAAAMSQGSGTRVVLLPNADGHRSTLTVTAGEQRLTIDQPYQVLDVSNQLRTTIGQTNAEAVQAEFASVLSLTPPAEEKFILYFQSGTTELSAESRETLAQLLAKVRERAGGELVVTAHTDRQGDAARNDSLSIERAQALRNQIVRGGFAPDRIRAYGRGEREPLVATEDGVAEARNRRAEVVVR